MSDRKDGDRLKKWNWIMEYCKNRGMSPTLGWKIAEAEYNKRALLSEREGGGV